MKKYFEKYPAKTLTVYFAVYHNLDDDEERQVFTKWNISITQSTDDFINSYKETIPTYDRLITEIPCTVYGSTKKMKIRDLINAYSASFETPYHGGESKTKMQLITYIKLLRDSDVDIIIKIFNIIKSIFDKENRKDWRAVPAFKNIIFRAIYYLVSNNLERLGEGYIRQRMRTTLVNRKILDDFRRYSGRRASVDAYMAFKQLLNDSDSEKKFI